MSRFGNGDRVRIASGLGKGLVGRVMYASDDLTTVLFDNGELEDIETVDLEVE